jgi:aspartyl-tRNA synthetase
MLIKNLFKILSFNNVIKRKLTNSSLSVFDSKNLQRTHYCGSLGIEHSGKNVRLCGWLQSVRSKNFILVRDVEGIVQVFLHDEFFIRNDKIKFDDLKEETVVSITGQVCKRPSGQENPKMKTGYIEVKCEKIELLNQSKAMLPFTITELNRPNESVRLKYRYLDLRFKEMQQNLILRSSFVHSVRQFMQENKFFDIETPTLFRRTPGIKN